MSQTGGHLEFELNSACSPKSIRTTLRAKDTANQLFFFEFYPKMSQPGHVEFERRANFRTS